jgi:DNA (cytosine-5)-methyltransferase 1
VNVALRPADRLDYISLCTGAGGLDLGVELAIPSARAIVLVEREAPSVATLVAAMEAGCLAPAPVWSDVRSLDGRRWRGCVDGVVGGIPCQPHSVAGKRLGRDDPRDL